MINRFAVLVIAAAATTVAAPAFAEEVGVGVGPVGVTVGSGPDRVVREREVVRERDHRPDKVIIKKEHDDRPVVEKKTIIHDRD
jgi:hypothetical protein